MKAKPRELAELISIGPAMLRDFELLGIHSVAQLARQNPQRLYEKLGRAARQQQDICVLDVFRAAVEQAKKPRLPAEQCQWWYWSRKRKQRARKQRSKDWEDSVAMGETKKDNAKPLRALRRAERPGRRPRAARRLGLTTPDLVLLSLLAERPMHGYQANLELERREIRDWAGISRPQVYYSLDKLARAGLICAAESVEPAAGPDRSVFETTAKGRHALAGALERKEWTTQRERPPFLTWMALSWQARPGVFRKQIHLRQEFVKGELAREKETLRSILKEVGHPYHEAVWMVSLVIEQFKVELKWLQRLLRELPRRAPARNPAYADRGSD